MKDRHKLSQRQRQRATSQSRRSEAQETDEQPRSGAGKAKKSSMLHMKAEGGRTKLRLDKFRRGGRRAKRYDNGGPAGSSAASTRSADDREENFYGDQAAQGTLGRDKTNCSAQSRLTSVAADRSIVDTTPAAQLLRQSRSVRPRCRTSPSHPSQTPLWR